MNTHPNDAAHHADPDNTDPDDAQLRGLLGGPRDRLRADVRMERTLHQITTHGRRLRRRHRYAVSTAGVAAVAAIAVGVAVVPGAVSGTAQHPNTAGGLKVDLADFALQTNADGTIGLTFKQFGDAPLVQQYLTRLGIKNQVQAFQFDSATLPTGCSPDQELTAQELEQTRAVVTPASGPGAAAGDAVVLHPDAMPAGATLAITIVQVDSPGLKTWGASFEVFDGAVPSCTPSPS